MLGFDIETQSIVNDFQICRDITKFVEHSSRNMNIDPQCKCFQAAMVSGFIFLKITYRLLTKNDEVLVNVFGGVVAVRCTI